MADKIRTIAYDCQGELRRAADGSWYTPGNVFLTLSEDRHTLEITVESMGIFRGLDVPLPDGPVDVFVPKDPLSASSPVLIFPVGTAGKSLADYTQQLCRPPELTPGLERALALHREDLAAIAGTTDPRQLLATLQQLREEARERDTLPAVLIAERATRARGLDRAVALHRADLETIAGTRDLQALRAAWEEIIALARAADERPIIILQGQAARARVMIAVLHMYKNDLEVIADTVDPAVLRQTYEQLREQARHEGRVPAEVIRTLAAQKTAEARRLADAERGEALRRATGMQGAEGSPRRPIPRQPLAEVAARSTEDAPAAIARRAGEPIENSGVRAIVAARERTAANTARRAVDRERTAEATAERKVAAMQKTEAARQRTAERKAVATEKAAAARHLAVERGATARRYAVERNAAAAQKVAAARRRAEERRETLRALHEAQRAGRALRAQGLRIQRGAAKIQRERAAAEAARQRDLARRHSRLRPLEDGGAHIRRSMQTIANRDRAAETAVPHRRLEATGQVLEAHAAAAQRIAETQRAAEAARAVATEKAAAAQRLAAERKTAAEARADATRAARDAVAERIATARRLTAERKADAVQKAEARAAHVAATRKAAAEKIEAAHRLAAERKIAQTRRSAEARAAAKARRAERLRQRKVERAARASASGVAAQGKIAKAFRTVDLAQVVLPAGATIVGLTPRDLTAHGYRIPWVVLRDPADPTAENREDKALPAEERRQRHQQTRLAIFNTVMMRAIDMVTTLGIAPADIQIFIATHGTDDAARIAWESATRLQRIVPLDRYGRPSVPVIVNYNSSAELVRSEGTTVKPMGPLITIFLVPYQALNGDMRAAQKDLTERLVTLYRTFLIDQGIQPGVNFEDD